MKHYSGITTLIFDFGGVIINLDIDKCILNLKQLGVENAEQYLSNFGHKDFFLQFEKGQIGVEEFRNEIRNLVAKPLTDRQIDEAWCSFLCDIPLKKLEIILALKKKFRILLLSNTNPLHIEVSAAGEFAKIGKEMSEYFHRCYLSYEMKMAKPNADIFQALLVNEQVASHQCLFLDDGSKNIEQAEKLGFQTYLVDVNEDLSFLLTNVKGVV